MMMFGKEMMICSQEDAVCCLQKNYSVVCTLQCNYNLSKIVEVSGHAMYTEHTLATSRTARGDGPPWSLCKDKPWSNG